MDTDIAIIGAGVVGLAVAAEISRPSRDVVVLERHGSFGQDTSSRSSEVIHAGLYYPKDSLKARLCVEGKERLYEVCRKAGIPHRRIGKIVVATRPEEVEELENLEERAKSNGVLDVHLLSSEEIRNQDPRVRALAALVSPSTGIVDSHSLMKRLEFTARNRGALISYNCEATAIEKVPDGYRLSVLDADGEGVDLAASIVVNCAGLHADRIAAMVGIDVAGSGYSLRYTKGEFYKVCNRDRIPLDRLVYPLPQSGFLGTHTVLDLAGEARIGPNTYAIEKKIDCQIDDSRVKDALADCQRFLPALELDDLAPDMAGISPRLEGEGRDFVIAEESDKGCPGFINLIGIDSPGLTCSPAIGRRVSRMI
ncbi:MAG TPA: NAD(P)/FAD-dependent oxidoreductase [Sumerlaeia bacterium]|nr:NAD(P)/FAD-dependent oxidoreductase [Sumerlaeia bacterium]